MTCAGLSSFRQRAVVLFAHGSRDAAWRAPIEAVAAQVLAMEPATVVRCAYLEWSEPDLASAVADLAGRGVNYMVVLPLFLGVGKHAREDLPRMVAELRDQYPNVEFDLRPAVGEDPRLIEVLGRIAVS